jgi:hypothetical protein
MFGQNSDNAGGVAALPTAPVPAGRHALLPVL